MLQAYIEEVFATCSRISIPRLYDDDIFKAYRETRRGWGNPNAENINRLFARLGFRNLIQEIPWSGMADSDVVARLKELNELRNKIAHGQRPTNLSLSLRRVRKFRDFAYHFGEQFAVHALKKAQSK